jgi:hypothetical protein
MVRCIRLVHRTEKYLSLLTSAPTSESIRVTVADHRFGVHLRLNLAFRIQPLAFVRSLRCLRCLLFKDPPRFPVVPSGADHRLEP